MKPQNFKTHSQYLPGFHMLTFAAILVAFIFAVILMVSLGINTATVFAILVTASLGLLFFYTRQFATGNQDRVIRAEENFRSYRLTGKLLDDRLTRSQIIALRFADDNEYAELSDKAIQEDLSPTDIKKAISQWRADHHRI
jgi:hypothetical protein